MSTGPPKITVDDDVDDLDDVLDEFTDTPSPNSLPPPPPPTATAPGTRARTNTRVGEQPRSIPGSGLKLGSTNEEENVDVEAFSAEFSRQLESLLKEITTDPSSSSSSTTSALTTTTTTTGSDGMKGAEMTDEEKSKTLKAAWEAMLVEGMDGADPGDLETLGHLLGSEGVRPASGNNKPGASDFRSKIKQAQGKLKESEESFQTNDSSSTTTDPLEKLLRELGMGEGGEEDKELTEFLENMMGQLISKEVLYEPLKELADKFPGYLANPPEPITPEDKARYEKQNTCVHQIIEIFDKPTYSDSSKEDTAIVMGLMSEMQGYGSPPSEIMGPLPPDFGENGIPQLGENCVIA